MYHHNARFTATNDNVPQCDHATTTTTTTMDAKMKMTDDGDEDEDDRRG